MSGPSEPPPSAARPGQEGLGVGRPSRLAPGEVGASVTAHAAAPGPSSSTGSVSPRQASSARAIVNANANANLTASPARPTPLRRPVSPAPPSILSSSYTDTEADEYLAPSRPRTAHATTTASMYDSSTTPRGGPPREPRTATGAYGDSPETSTYDSGGSRPRLPRHNTSTSHPVSYPAMPRSISRSRPQASRGNTGVITPFAGVPKKKEDAAGDEEAEEEDRGAALIKQRQLERKKARRAKEKEKEQRAADKENEDGQGGRVRSVSRGREPSTATEGRGTRRQPSESYFSGYASSVAETPRLEASFGDKQQAPSVYSALDEEEDERSQDPQSRLEEVVNEVVGSVSGEDTERPADDEDDLADGDEGVTLRDRQDAINIEHPFGLPIWKPALYRKSRSVTRNAESALHAIPSAAAQRHFLPGNILWALVFGWWLALTCLVVALLVSGAEVLGGGRGGYGKTLRGLAWYIGWPFGKYVQGEGAPDESGDDEDSDAGKYGSWAASDGSPIRPQRPRELSDGASSGVTVRNPRNTSHAWSASTVLHAEDGSAGTVVNEAGRREASVSFAPSPSKQDKPTRSIRSAPSVIEEECETAPLLTSRNSTGMFRRPRNKRAKVLGRIVYWPVFALVLAPIMLLVCVVCWGLVFTIPMAKLTWKLLGLLYWRPLEINFRSAPQIAVPTSPPSPPLEGSPLSAEGSGDTTAVSDGSPTAYTLKRARLKVGQVAPTSGPKSTVLLCVYRAMGSQYYKYTVGGVNILFINLLPMVFFTIIDAMLLLPHVEHMEKLGHHVPPFVRFVTSQALIFVLGLASVIPLSYFLGMAVASISAQSSIGMGAVINATFGSIIEIILYGIALTQGKGRLVEGSIVGSILAGVLLMPGASMCSGALKRKEQKFNAKSAGVTSTMLIMAIIGTLTPTMFYQTYGSFELHCQGCPEPTQGQGFKRRPEDAWQCNQCFYEHPAPATDPFYQDQVKGLMYACAAILLFSYLIGLWFSLRTHASQIWQNPQQLMKVDELPAGAMHPAHRVTLTQRVAPQAIMQTILPTHKASTRPSSPVISTRATSPSAPRALPATLKLTSAAKEALDQQGWGAESASGSGDRSTSHRYALPEGYTPFLEGVNRDLKSRETTPFKLPGSITTDDFTRAVAVATVTALKHQNSIIGRGAPDSARRSAVPPSMGGGGGAKVQAEKEEEEEGGAHEAPSWTRGVSYGVLISCTMLYAIIAEVLVDVVDVVLQGSGIDEKFLGLTLFALVPNTTEFMNAMSFAMNGNIALSMEIGSAYALQVCLLQIPAMVAFSALYDPGELGEMVDTFTLIFPRWDVIAIILSIFLLTYTYIEARSNYHRGSILVLAYVVLMMGFYFAPPKGSAGEGDRGDPDVIFGAGEAALSSMSSFVAKLWV